MISTVTTEGISKAATILSASMQGYTIPCHDRGHIIFMLVLQSYTDSLQVMAGSSSKTFPLSSDFTYDVDTIKLEEHIDIKEETFATSPDGTYDVGNIKFEEDIGIQEEGELNVKTEMVIVSEEEECIDIKDEKGIYTEEEEEEEIDTKEEKDVDVKEEVS